MDEYVAMFSPERATAVDQDRRQALQPWMTALLSATPERPAGALPLDEAQQEGVLPWLAYRLHDSGLLKSLGEQQAEIQKVLKLSAASHLYGEGELSRLSALADACQVTFMVFKGHAVARTLYPHPACRPTSDFDVLVAPEQVTAAHDWLREARYRPCDPYFGNYWLASQMWIPEDRGPIGGSLDLHWDISNRMYFRHRMAIAHLIRNAQRVPCGACEIRVPGRIDNCIVACIHLAAMDPGLPVQLRWLLDIRLLMAEIAGLEIDHLVERAREWQAVEACLVFGEAAAKLDESGAMEPVLKALRAAASERRMAEYDRTLRSRGYDLWRYWLRLGGRDKVGLLGDLFRKISHK